MSKHIPPPAPPSLAPHQQAQAATLITTLKAHLFAEDLDLTADETLWRDIVDGETDALDLIRALIRASIDADLTAEAARQRQTEIADRAERRKQPFRTAALARMDLAGLTRLPEPDFTARVQAGPARLDELDPDALPPEFVEVEVTVTRRPLKDRLLAALKVGQTIRAPASSAANPSWSSPASRTPACTP
jgi:hypothetical protein